MGSVKLVSMTKDEDDGVTKVVPGKDARCLNLGFSKMLTKTLNLWKRDFMVKMFTKIEQCLMVTQWRQRELRYSCTISFRSIFLLDMCQCSSFSLRH